MSKLTFIWNIDNNKKVKIKEIREYNIVRENNDEKSEYFVDAFGFFHGAVRIFKGSKMDCIAFVDSLTERTGNKQDVNSENIEYIKGKPDLSAVIKEKLS